MDLHITDHHDPIRLFVNGTLQAELVGGVVQDAGDLAAEVTQARALQALARFVRHWERDLAAARQAFDHNYPTSHARQVAYCQGVEAGLQGLEIPHPSGPLVPPLPPDHTPSFQWGYGHGRAMRRALMLAEGVLPMAQEEAPRWAT